MNSTISFPYSDSRSKIIIGVKSVIFPKDYKKGVVMAGMDGLKIQSSSVITLELRNLKNTSLMWNVNNIKVCTLRLLDSLIFLFSSYITRRDFFQILWKSRCDSLVTFPSHLKKSCSKLRFWLEKLNCGFFHSFHSRKNTTKQLFHSKFQCRK